ncbi:hypothetical protein Tco_0134495 [Tanacetum coccineum]
MLLYGSLNGSCDQQAVRKLTGIQLQGYDYDLRIQLDGLKVENVESGKDWYDELVTGEYYSRQQGTYCCDSFDCKFDTGQPLTTFKTDCSIHYVLDTMADMNIPANDVPAEQAPRHPYTIRTVNDQILPILAIHIQQFWDIMCYDSSTGMYRSPPSSDTAIEYVNTLGYPSTLKNVSAMSVNFLYQPWRAILSMINMCLTGKTAGYDRPRHLVLHILWGIIHRSNIDYAERIWEEFVQSYQTFLTNKKNLTTAARRKKKSIPLLILSIRFTKLIIHYLKTKHNIHPRTNSPLHYSHNEIVLGTPRSLGKDGREIFGMPIPDALLTDEIKRAPYYGEYLEHVTKYQQYLDEERGKTGEDEVTESPKSTKVTKPKAAKQTKPSAPKAAKVTKPADDKSPKQTSSQPPKSTPAPTEPSKKDQIDKFVDKGVLEKELIYGDEEANLQRALELSRRTPLPTEPSGIVDSPSLDADLAPTDNETKSDEEVPEINAGDQDEGQAGPNPGVQDEGQARSNPGDATESQPQSSHVVHAGPNLERIDLETNDASTQQNTEQMDDEFTTTAYPNVQENIKLPIEDQVILEDPTSSTGTLSSLQNLDKELGFTSQFLEEKP